jgi:hypothetical protein
LAFEAKTDKRIKRKGFAVIGVVVLCAAAAGLTSSGTLLALSQHEGSGRAQRTLTLEERVSYQRAIEDVYWRHRIWPKERPDPKPSLDAVISQARLEKKVRDYLRRWRMSGNDPLLLSSYKLRWIVWRKTPGSQKC